MKRKHKESKLDKEMTKKVKENERKAMRKERIVQSYIGIALKRRKSQVEN